MKTKEVPSGLSALPVILSCRPLLKPCQTHVDFSNLSDQECLSCLYPIIGDVQPVFDPIDTVIKHLEQNDVDQNADQGYAQCEVKLSVGHHDRVHAP